MKIITVNPKSRLSLQRHERRSERWFGLDDGLIAEVWNGKFHTRMTLSEGKSIIVDAGNIHRISNPTNKPLRLVELMYGVYDEEDIERLEDDYDRR